MGAIIKIAFRNIREHKTKTLIIGGLMALGIFLMLVGNSLMDTASEGIRKNYIRNFTGNVVISAKYDDSVSLFDGVFPGSDIDLRKISRIDEIENYLNNSPKVSSYSGQVGIMSMFTKDDKMSGVGILFGILPEAYTNMFPDNLIITEGRFLEEGETGIVLSETSKEMAGNFGMTSTIEVGDKIILNTMGGSAGTKIREVEVVGYFRFVNPQAQLNMVSLVDVDSARYLHGMSLIADADVILSEQEASILSDFNEDDLFGDDSFGAILAEEGAKTEDELMGVLGDTSGIGMFSATDSGAWHYLLIKTNNEGQAGQLIDELNKFFISEGIDAQAFDWITAAGETAKTVDNIRIILNIIILIIAIVSVIIIMNTLVISITERIPEIGTMRAIGAKKSFIRGMITGETVMIAGIFGFVGLALGAIVIGILYMTGIPANNMMLEVIFGGKVLKPVLSGGALMTSFLTVVSVGVVASLYPVAVALKIKPVIAMQSK
jgi:putative ABC transport system permease protein